MQQPTITYPYTYDDLLDRLHMAKISEDDNYHSGKKNSLPPMVVKPVNRTSVIVNFNDYSLKLNRTKDHIARYFFEETTAKNSINEQNQLIIQGKLNGAKCESIMKNYIRQYVLCKQCKCIDTVLVKENGITIIHCNHCQAQTSLGKI